MYIISNKSSAEFARKLLELGADASAQAQHGKTPLHCVSGRGDVRVACVDVRAQSKDWVYPRCIVHRPKGWWESLAFFSGAVQMRQPSPSPLLHWHGAAAGAGALERQFWASTYPCAPFTTHLSPSTFITEHNVQYPLPIHLALKP